MIKAWFSARRGTIGRVALIGACVEFFIGIVSLELLVHHILSEYAFGNIMILPFAASIVTFFLGFFGKGIQRVAACLLSFITFNLVMTIAVTS